MTGRHKPLTREQQAKLEIGHTEFSLGVKWTLLAVGLITLFAVPTVQTYRELRQHAEGRRESAWPQCCDIIDAWPQAAAACRAHDGSWISKLFRGNTVLDQAIDKYEKDLKAESFLTQYVVPPTQEILACAGSGNEQGYVGRQRWLFYRPGIDYCTGPGFLDPRTMVRRADWRHAVATGPAARPARQFSSSSGSLPRETFGWWSCQFPTRRRSTLRNFPRMLASRWGCTIHRIGSSSASLRTRVCRSAM